MTRPTFDLEKVRQDVREAQAETWRLGHSIAYCEPGKPGVIVEKGPDGRKTLSKATHSTARLIDSLNQRSRIRRRQAG